MLAVELRRRAAVDRRRRVAPDPLPVPSASEVSLARARAWSASGRLRDALTALDAIRPGDPLRAQADELRARDPAAAARLGARDARRRRPLNEMPQVPVLQLR